MRNRRVSSDTAVNRRIVVMDTPDGPVEIDRCWNCPRLAQRICLETGLQVAFPISGPVLEQCPLPAKDQDKEEP